LWRRLQTEATHHTFLTTLVFPIAVYPQKQQPYAYGYAYPGPYYHGAAYGPYAQYWVEKRWWAVAADTQKKFSAASSPFVWMDDGCFLSAWAFRIYMKRCLRESDKK
jgi:hypothetical protein